jgi:predicted dehydrogenase
MADALRAAFVGFQHMHIFDIYAQAQKREDVRITAVCEEDPETRSRLAGERGIPVSHSVFEQMLASVEFDLLVVGSVFAARGALILRALEAGKHVLSDKPITTELGELEEIRTLAERRGLVVGAALDLRDRGALLRTRELVRSGEIGAVRAVAFSGQHPLLPDSRPRWYFTKGNHGGTINDLAIHAVDLLPWVTGGGFTEILAARCWSAGPEASRLRFRNAAQLMLFMDGECGVIGDVSYIAPDGLRYSLPQYWRFNFWGDLGMIESGYNLQWVRLYRSRAEAVEEIEPLPDRPGGYLDDVIDAIRTGSTAPNASLFAATEVCLKAQQAADQGVFPVALKV